MNLTSLDPNVLRELLKLSEQKAGLAKQIEAVDAKIAALSSGKAAPKAKAGRPAGKKRGRPAKKAVEGVAAPKAKRGKRGALKNDILKLLGEAGPEGISVKDVSAKLGVKNQNVHVWFSTTGKKMAEIAKVGEARYALKPVEIQS